MSILITTQSYKNDIPTEYGYLLEADENNGSIIRMCKIETPDLSNVLGERIKPGLRGLFVYEDKIYVSTTNKVIAIDPKSFKAINEYSHKWMSDLHGIYVNHDGIWVTSSLLDAAILYDFDCRPRNALWFSETFLYKERLQVDKAVDWRLRGKYFRGFRQFHANHIELKNGQVCITGRGKKNNGRIIRIEKNHFLKKEHILDKDINLFAKGLHGAHDGIWHNGLFWITESAGSTIAAINQKGKIVYRKKIKKEEGEKVTYGSIKERISTNIRKLLLNMPGKKIALWTRGMCFTNTHIFVGQSTWSGDSYAKARVIKIEKKTNRISDCFYFDIPDYPEQRIFQLWIYQRNRE